MKINQSIYFKELYYGDRQKLFKDNHIIRGKILEAGKEYILIDVINTGVIRARCEVCLDNYTGKTMDFLVLESLPDRIRLKPMIESIESQENPPVTGNRDEFLKGILKKFNIRESLLSVKMLDNIMKFNLSINREMLIHNMDVLDKLTQILSMSGEENIISINPNNEDIDIWKEDIRNLIVSEANNGNEFSAKAFNSEHVYKAINEFTDDFFSKEIDNQLLKSIIFFTEHGLKPSLRNMKYFLDINKNLTLFSKDYEMFKEISDVKFTNYLKSIMINSDDLNSQNRIMHASYKDILNKTLEYYKPTGMSANANVDSNVEKALDRIEFLKEMNEGLNFIYLPLDINGNVPDALIALINRKNKKASYGDKINIFISLNAKRLGKIKIYCQVSGAYMDIKFDGTDKMDISLFKSHEYELINLVQTAGYRIRTIEYFKKNDYAILDFLSINTNVAYCLDVQV